jgi:hypothetical protein
MNWKSLAMGLALAGATILGSSTAHAGNTLQRPHATLFAAGLDGAIGSTIGPDGALYVTRSTTGEITRVNPRTGAITTFASGLPKQISAIGLGGAMDVAFIGQTAYVLVTIVSPDVGGTDVDGIYRVDGPHKFTVIADIGTFNIQNQPTIHFDVAVHSGVLFAMQPYHGGFLVTDGHLNRVLQVSLDGTVSVLRAFGDIVPTGLAMSGKRVYMAEAGPVPHQPQDGRVVRFKATSSAAKNVASGASLLVDVEFGSGRTLYALSQGAYSGKPAGSPALPDTGSLVQVNKDGTFTVIASGLDRPTSLEFIDKTAYVVTLTGQIWKIQTTGK